jgi:hypothetical protein
MIARGVVERNGKLPMFRARTAMHPALTRISDRTLTHLRSGSYPSPISP